MSRPYTEDEVRTMFINRIKAVMKHIKDTKPDAPEEVMAHSILAQIDGCTMLPAFDLVLRPHPEDKDYYISQNENYFENGIAINSNDNLRYLLFKD